MVTTFCRHLDTEFRSSCGIHNVYCHSCKKEVFAVEAFNNQIRSLSKTIIRLAEVVDKVVEHLEE